MANTLFIGKVYLRFDELPSTNDYARELIAKSKPPEGTAIRADSQSAGRGQIGSTWHSTAGQNLTLSLVLYPQWLSANSAFLLSKAVALAICDTVKLLTGQGEQVQVKWPNDVYLDQSKVAGILIQNTLQKNLVQSAVVGIGLNVNQVDFPELLTKAGSLALSCKREFDLDAVMNELFVQVEKRYLQLKNNQSAMLSTEYLEALLGYKQDLKYREPGGPEFYGRVLDVKDDGQLVLQTESGVRQYFAKSVQMV